MSNTQFVKGLNVYKPKDGAPSFIIANGTIYKGQLMAWLDSQPDTIRIVIKDGQKGFYPAVDTWKPNTNAAAPVAASSETTCYTCPAGSETPNDLPF